MTKKSMSAAQVLEQYYGMMFPQDLMENEYIRLVAISKGEDGKTNRFVRYVQGFEQYKDFVMKYRAGFDLFNQIATNRGMILIKRITRK